jgi:hypothetical protein
LFPSFPRRNVIPDYDPGPESRLFDSERNYTDRKAFHWIARRVRLWLFDTGSGIAYIRVLLSILCAKVVVIR